MEIFRNWFHFNRDSSRVEPGTIIADTELFLGLYRNNVMKHICKFKNTLRRIECGVKIKIHTVWEPHTRRGQPSQQSFQKMVTIGERGWTRDGILSDTFWKHWRVNETPPSSPFIPLVDIGTPAPHFEHLKMFLARSRNDAVSRATLTLFAYSYAII